MIVEEIQQKGFARVFNIQNCIDKVKEILNIELEVNENMDLIFKNTNGEHKF